MLELLKNMHVQALAILVLLILQMMASRRPVPDATPLRHLITSGACVYRADLDYV